MNTSFSYETLLTEDDRAGLAEWVAETGELFVYLEFPRAPCAGDWWLVRSVDHLAQLLASVAWPQMEVTVLRRPQLPLRGSVDDDLRRRALELIPDGKWYAIVEIAGRGPFFCKQLSGGDTHAELARDLASIDGKSVAIGLDPIENSGVDEPGWVFHCPNEAFFLAMRRNRHGWPPYDQTPPDPIPRCPEYVGGKRPGL